MCRTYKKAEEKFSSAFCGLAQLLIRQVFPLPPEQHPHDWHAVQAEPEPLLLSKPEFPCHSGRQPS